MDKRKVILFHISFWIIVAFFSFQILFFSKNTFSLHFYLARVAKMLLEIIDFYLVYLVIVPRFYSSKKIPRYLIVSLAYLVVFYSFYMVFLGYADYWLGETDAFNQIWSYATIAVYYTFLYYLLGTLVRLSVNAFQTEQQKQVLEKQNLNAELSLLKSQINPHFLFNTLNNIHSFTSDNPDKAGYSIIKLSEIMRYMLYDAKKEKVLLSDEISYIKSYISLQSIRLEKKDYISFTVNGQLKEVHIPPLIFIPFIENAFKHGRKNIKSPGITIDLDITESIQFRCSNYIKKDDLSNLQEKGGFGLTNIKRRLELIYGEKYTLNISVTEEQYITDLIIPLKHEN